MYLEFLFTKSASCWTSQYEIELLISSEISGAEIGQILYAKTGLLYHDHGNVCMSPAHAIYFWHQ